MSQYASPEETAALVRQATPDETWLAAQLDRIHPHRHEMGSADTTQALTILVHELRLKNTYLKGEANVMCALLEGCLKVLDTLEPEDDNEHDRLELLKDMIIAVVKAQLERMAA